MLLLFLIWGYTAFISFTYGYWLIKNIANWFNLSTQDIEFSFPILSLTGIVFVTLIGQFFSLFYSLSTLFQSILMLGSILIAVNNYKQLISTLHTDANKIKKWPTIIKIMGLFILATIFIINGIPPTIYDTGLYHAQAISWLESYGVVPGLANIHVRFGTTSSWFQTAAIFGHSWTTQLFNTDRFRLFDDFSYIFHPINGYLFIILSIYLIQGIQKIPRHPIKLSNWVKLFILFFALYIFIDDIASPAPNTAIAFFTWWIFLLYLEKIEDSSIPQFDLNTFYVFFFSIFAISIKLSGVPLLLFPFALLLFSGSFAKKWRLVKLLILLSIVWGLMIIINLLLSGYIIFPFPAVDLFNFDWEYPKQLAQNYKSTIISWARIPRTPSAEVINMPFSQWFPIWFLRQADSHTPIFVFFLTSGVSYWGWNLLRIKKLFNSTNQNHRIRLSLFILYLNLLYWFITAPDFRFSYAVLILIIILHTLDIIYKPLKSIFVSSTVFNIYTAANLLILSITIFLNAQIFSNSNLWKTILVTPLGYYSESVEKIEHNGITFTSPIEGDQCWGAPLPCSPYVGALGVELMGEELSDGFRPIPRENP